MSGLSVFCDESRLSEFTEPGREFTRVDELDHSSLEVELGRDEADVTEAGRDLGSDAAAGLTPPESLLTEFGREILAAGDTHSLLDEKGLNSA